MACVALAATSCSSDSDEPQVNPDSGFKPACIGYKYVAPVASRASLDLDASTVTDFNDWAFEVTRLTAKNCTGRTFILSPVSLSCGLSMMASSIDSDVAGAVARSAGMDDVDRLETVATGLMSYLSHESHQSRLFFANSVWNDVRITLTESYRDRMARLYGAPVTQLDFSSDIAEEVFLGWVSDYTEGMITDIDFPLVGYFKIAGTFFFQSDWAQPFKAEDTALADFMGRKATAKVQMMHGVKISSYYRDEKLELLVLPYKGDFSLCLFLPAENITPEQLAADMTYDRFMQILTCTMPSRADVSLPKLDINMETSIKYALEVLGYPSEEEIPFALSAETCEQPLYLDEDGRRMRQNVALRLDENGTKAAAVTHNGIYTSNSYEEVEIEFNRPFMLMIINNGTKVPVLTGIINNVD